MSSGDEDYEDEHEEVTTEEKKLIARLFICKSSAGEAKDLAVDLQSILGKDLLTDDLVRQYILDRSEKFYDFADGEEIILCEHSKTDGGYQNPSTGEVVEFDVSKTGVKATERKEGEVEANEFRDKVAAALKKHMKEHYLTELYATRVSAVYAKGDDITCIISSKNTNLASFWTGNWQCTYTFTKGGNAIKAQLKINVHYYEGGNVQLNSSKTREIECDCKGDDGGVKNVIKEISDFENEFQNGISNYYAENQDSFKKVRRGLTIQGTKFDWRVAIHENITDMKN